MYFKRNTEQPRHKRPLHPFSCDSPQQLEELLCAQPTGRERSGTGVVETYVDIRVDDLANISIVSTYHYHSQILF